MHLVFLSVQSQNKGLSWWSGYSNERIIKCSSVIPYKYATQHHKPVCIEHKYPWHTFSGTLPLQKVNHKNTRGHKEHATFEIKQFPVHVCVHEWKAYYKWLQLQTRVPQNTYPVCTKHCQYRLYLQWYCRSALQLHIGILHSNSIA